MNTKVAKLTTGELQTFFDKHFTLGRMVVEENGPGYCRIRYEIGDQHLRPGNTVSGPVLFMIADCATYGALLSDIGLVPLAVTTSATINFLRKPLPRIAIIGEATMLKVGKRLGVAEVKMFSEKNKELLAHATLTYSIPPEG